MASTFRFTLQPALDDAAARERAALARFAVARAALHAHLRELATLRAREAALRERSPVGEDGIAAAGAFAERETRARAAAAATEGGAAAVAAARGRAEREAAGARAQGARRGAFEALRARRFAAFARARERSEASELDDANALRRSAYEAHVPGAGKKSR